MRMIPFGLPAAGVALAALAASLVIGCDDKKPSLPPAAMSLASATPPPPTSTLARFAVDSASKTTLLMDAPIEKIKASATNAAGSLDIDLANVPVSRGEVKIDLSTLTTSSFGDAAKDALQTQHARTWLEVGDGEDGKLDDKVKDANRWAIYAIRSVENVSAPDVTKLAPTKEGADDVRTVTLTTKGELLVHGIKTPRDADVELKFRYDEGSPATKPRELSITSRKPFRVVLADHEVKPRDGLGKLKKSAFQLLGTKVADNADITLDLRAKPQP